MSIKLRALFYLSPKTTSFFSSFRVFSSSLCKCHAVVVLPPPPPPPLPKKVPFQVSAHGMTWQDPYHWMSGATDDPDLRSYLGQENSYAEAFMTDTHSLRRKLSSEMTARIPARISSPPQRWGRWLYHQDIPEGKEFPILSRRLEVEEESNWVGTVLRCAGRGLGGEETLLDWNQIAEEHGYVHVGTCRVSPDHNFLAYTIDVTGGEDFVLQVKDLRTGRVVPNFRVQRVVSVAWAQDARTLFYTQSDDNQRPFRVLYSKLDSDDIDGVSVFTESESSFCVDITSTKDGKFITVNSNSRTSSEEVYIIDSTNPSGKIRKIRDRVPGIQYFVEHHRGFFYILTNSPSSENKEWSGENYYLARCPVVDIQSTNWQNIIVPRDDFTIQDMDVFDGFLVLYINKKGNSTFCSINLPINVDCEHQREIGDLDPWFFPVPSDSCSVVPGSNLDYLSSVFRAVLSSPVMPDMTVDYDMSTRTFSIVYQEDGVSPEPDTEHQFDSKRDIKRDDACYGESQRWKDLSDKYCCETKEVVSHDGTKVPMTVLYSRTAWQKGRSPGLLQGYGAYGEVLEKSWCTNRLSLLDRGWVVAFADVRGGGGGDSSWHESGSGLNKRNSIRDFVSCANFLVNEGFVHKHRLGGIGHSAGSLLLGAAINMFPDLFRAAIMKVPFLDVCNTLLDDNLPLTRLDYEEFGDPRIRSMFECILSYSPYDNISQGRCYPSMLVTASLNDTRVGVWEAAKWVAKVRDTTCSACSASVILKTSMTGGHFGEGGRVGQCDEDAYDYAFLLKAMGMFE